MRGKRVHITGGMNKAMVLSTRFLSEEIQSHSNEKLDTDVLPEDQKREWGDIEKEAVKA